MRDVAHNALRSSSENELNEGNQAHGGAKLTSDKIA